METKIFDALCILPRIELLNGYLEEEIDELERYLRESSAKENVILHCNKIRQLIYITEDISSKVYNDVKEVLGV